MYIAIAMYIAKYMQLYDKSIYGATAMAIAK